MFEDGNGPLGFVSLKAQCPDYIAEFALITLLI